MRFKGEQYERAALREQDIKAGTLVVYAHGKTVRRIIALDGDEVILRGARSADVFEAVDLDQFMVLWDRIELVS